MCNSLFAFLRVLKLQLPEKVEYGPARSSNQWLQQRALQMSEICDVSFDTYNCNAICKQLICASSDRVAGGPAPGRPSRSPQGGEILNPTTHMALIN